MGSHNFYESAVADSAWIAYADLVDRAVWEFGNDPYSGTIATTQGYEIHQPRADESLDAWCERAEDNTRKWEACWCCEFDGRYHFAGWAAC